MRRSLLKAFTPLVLLVAATLAAAADPRVAVVARGLVDPWALAFLPDGRMLVTERAGRLRMISARGEVGPALAGLPAVAGSGQCGLLDLVLAPDFASSRELFFTFAEPAAEGNTVAVARARLEAERLADVRVIFRQQPRVDSRLHCGSRLAFGADGFLYVGLGDRFSRKDDAQDVANHLGKVVRIDRDGRPAPGNPFAGRAGAAPEVFSLGHRNIQGLALRPGSGEIWLHEHGPQGGDEVNRIDAGKNYGWPLITFGRNYGLGTRIGETGPKAGFEPPRWHWKPVSIAPSGMAFVSSDRYPGWKGSLLIGGLRSQALHRLQLQGDQVLGEQQLLTALGERVRDVREGPDGLIYVLTDGAGGQLLRLEPR